MTRQLRFRLTLSYVVLFSVLLAGIGFFFRSLLNSIQKDQVADILEEEWGAIRGYLTFERQKDTGQFVPVWSYDREDPEEALIVERLRAVSMIADASGRELEVSPTFRTLGVPAPNQISGQVSANRVLIVERVSDAGVPYLVKSGVMIDEKRPFFVAIGRSLEENRAVLGRFTANYFALVPLLILACSLVGWFVSRRALVPVTELARKTEAVTGSNLSMRIPPRDAGDELDLLIANFNKMVERLEESFIQTRQFSTDVSHELRTPLTVIRGQLEVALMTAKSEEQYREAILAALQEVERLSNTVRALLHLSQAESGQLTLQMQSIDLSPLAVEMAEQFRLLADAASLTFDCEAQPGCFVRADRVQMERLISNLLSNAIKYTPEGGKVRMTLQPADGGVEMAVSDTGRGIPAEALPHIFDRFYRVPGAVHDPEKGLGLGLSFVAWIVRAHEGRIDVESKDGHGTTFRVWLPASPPRETTTVELKEAHGVRDTASRA